MQKLIVFWGILFLSIWYADQIKAAITTDSTSINQITQDSLSLYQTTQIKDLNHWLEQVGLDKYFYNISIIGFDSTNVYLSMDCSNPSILYSQRIWDKLNEVYQIERKKSFNQKFFSVLSTTLDYHFENIILGVYTSFGEKSMEIQYIDKQFDITKLEDNGLSFGESSITISPKNIAKIYDTTPEKLIFYSPSQLMHTIRTYLYNYYKDKGTPLLYNAQIDTSNIFQNECIIEITHLSNEILDKGYFEYIKFGVEIEKEKERLDKEDILIIHFDIQGKFGSGVFFAPRKNDYKNIEIHYPLELIEYEQLMRKKIKDYINKSLIDEE